MTDECGDVHPGVAEKSDVRDTSSRAPDKHGSKVQQAYCLHLMLPTRIWSASVPSRDVLVFASHWRINRGVIGRNIVVPESRSNSERTERRHA